MKGVYGNDSQWLFGYNLNGLKFFAKLFFGIILYSPILFTGYLVSREFIPTKSPGHIWIFSTLIFALVVYALSVTIRKIAFRLKQKGSHFWIVLFLLYIAFICIPPVMVSFPWAMYLTSQNLGLSWGMETFFVLIIYQMYMPKSNRLRY
jgi:hypothetical protein